MGFRNSWYVKLLNPSQNHPPPPPSAEHFHLYMQIRNITQDKRDTFYNVTVKELQLTEHMNKRINQLSGGTKRKVNFCLSILSNDKILALLDEPSTGMDPASKQHFWSIIQQEFSFDSQDGSSSLLTTHSMEEADALCDRLGIMVNGKLVCIGTPAHLKNQYGSGYLLELKLADEGVRERVQAAVEGKFSQAEIEEADSVYDRLVFNIPVNEVRPLSSAFRLFEDLRGQELVSEYLFTETSLEQVFIRFAKEQNSEK